MIQKNNKKQLSKNQKNHIKVLKENVFEINNYPSFRLLIEGLENILIKYDFPNKKVCILERTKLYGTSLFGGLFQEAEIHSFDCSPESALERNSYNAYMVKSENFINYTDIISISQNKLFKLPNDKFDVIFIPNLIHHFRDQNKLFTECFKSLKDNGELVIFEPTFREVHQAPHDYIRYTPYGIKQKFEDCLFKHIECQEIGDSFEAITYILNVMMAKREDLEFLKWCQDLKKNISSFKKGKIDIVKDHARFPNAFLCSGFKYV